MMICQRVGRISEMGVKTMRPAKKYGMSIIKEDAAEEMAARHVMARCGEMEARDNG
jgi:hypothetical protein